MVSECTKPRYSEKMESGVLCFIVSGKMRGKAIELEAGLRLSWSRFRS